MFEKIFYFILVVSVGLALIVYTEPIKRFTGSIGFAEHYLGSGGTYSFYKLLGVLILIIAVLWVTGTLEACMPKALFPELASESEIVD